MLCFITFIFFKSTHEQVIPDQVFEIVWTDQYRIDGDRLRGFVKSRDGVKYYAVYQFKDEDEKNKYGEMSLSGMNFKVNAEFSDSTRPAHQYSFNMEKYLTSQGAAAAIDIQTMDFTGVEEGLSTRMADYRHGLQMHIQRTFPDTLVAEAEALIIGQRANIEQIDERAYQVLGITHLFAISGLHIGLITFFVYGVLFRVGFRKETVRLLIIVGLPLYALLAGGAPSIWRAVTTIELILLASQFRWWIGLDDAISISMFLFVLVKPSVVYQIGFQLSYAAAFSLIFSASILKNKSYLTSSLLITFICQLMVLPLLLFHFYELSLSSFILNLLFVPLFSFIILPANILLLCSTLLPGFFSDWLFYFYTPARGLLADLIRQLAQIPYQMWNPGKPTIPLLILSFIGVSVCFVQFEKKEYRKGFVFLVIPLLMIQLLPYTDRSLYITYLDVGQGDSIVIEMPYRQAVYIIDTGGVVRFGQEGWRERNSSYEVGRQVVVPYLKGRGIHTVDRLIISHADADHAEGADEIIEETQVKEIHISPGTTDFGVLQELTRFALKRNIPIMEVKEGSYWTLGEYSFKYLSPSDHIYEGNNDSLVLLLESQEFKALFTGDLETEGEEDLIRKFEEEIKEITVLKAGHHGSKTSSSEVFIRETMPSLTIFSAGIDNRYGHPHEEVMNRFQHYGLWTLSTADMGTIRVTVKKGEWIVGKM
ncbi:DNA internalization-related competence protein ComEC/Rec2 [Chungangia koreensis]|uniref:DNA internalization-related competence protein ComEC/Rec2 n=1 Tax=Chungangia koreensis TaxID=752657 RepID=A0ABV8X6N8_9LACT